MRKIIDKKRKKKNRSRELGPTAQKTLLLLKAGLILGLSGSPANYFNILRAVGKEWRDISKRSLHLAIKSLYESKLVDIEVEGEMFCLKLSDKGKERALKYELYSMEVPKMARWDGKWRIVLFDIPESKKKMRDALRFHLKKLGFFEFQKSVFIHPFECWDEIEFLIEFYFIRPYVRFVVAESVDNAFHLKKYFGL